MTSTAEGISHPVAYEPPKIPEPRPVLSQGHSTIAELKGYEHPRGDTSKSFKPKGAELVINPATEKWKSPIFKKPEILKKIEEITGKPRETLTHILERVIVNDATAYPWCTIGKIFVGWNSNYSATIWQGTGVLVGRNLMLTASHVAPWGQEGAWMRFVPAYNNGNEPLGSSYVAQWRGVTDFDGHPGLDYVICQLYDPLGEACGWMGTKSFGDDDDYKNRRWISVGYPGDSFNAQVPMVEPDLAVNDVDGDQDGKELETEYRFASPGWSGGPLWNFLGPDGGSDPRVVGILSGWEEVDFLWWTVEANDISAGGSHMVNLVHYGEDNWA